MSPERLAAAVRHEAWVRSIPREHFAASCRVLADTMERHQYEVGSWREHVAGLLDIRAGYRLAASVPRLVVLQIECDLAITNGRPSL